MSKDLYLCIGGGMDGSRIGMGGYPPPPVFRAPARMEASGTIESEPSYVPMAEQQYERQALRAGSREYFVYVCADDCGDDLIKRLIDGYSISASGD